MDALRGPMTLAGRVMLCTIFLMSAAGNKIPNFSQVASYMESVGVPAPQPMLVGAILFLLVGGVSVLIGFKARLGASATVRVPGVGNLLLPSFLDIRARRRRVPAGNDPVHEKHGSDGRHVDDHG